MFKKKFHWYSVHVVTSYSNGHATFDKIISIPMRKKQFCIDREFMIGAARRCSGAELNQFVEYEVVSYLGRFPS